MKYALLAVPVVGVLTYAWYSRAEANVYPMTADQAYAKLTTTQIEPSGQGPFGRLDTSVSGDGTSVVRWAATGAHASINCEANITPEGSSQSRITAHCGGSSPSSGAASGMLMAMNRKALIEHIDSTLRGRPYDFKLAQGATASQWPDDPRQPDGSFGTAAAQALEMERDTKKMIKDMEKTTDEWREKAEQERANAGVNFKPGEPMIRPSN